jgi:GT2 family glycosyltransferase
LSAVTPPDEAATSPSVTALVVSHDGSRWLGTVLDAVAAQTRRPDGLLAVDTGSTDGSVDLLHRRLGNDGFVTAPAHTSFGAAVARGLEALPPPGSEEDAWVWLLHDDSAPAPDALEQLLAKVADHPGVDVLGPKLREWPSLRRLLEVGVTISGTGRRETGLERGEYDQGQHDRQRDVLAVNTAGMLVRRSVLEELGFDERLPVFGNDIDFGWRAARAGHRTVVVPDAVVFHVEAAHRGVRRTDLTGRHFHRNERQAALYTLLANTSGRWLPFLWVRLLLGSLVRALGFLLVRSPGEARDELSALARVYARPVRVLSARRQRRRTATVGHADVKHLLAPAWLPYRHGLDFLSDLAAALTSQATDMSAARRARVRPVEASETGPVPAEAQNLPEDTGLVARLLRSPFAGVLLVTVVLAFIAGRDLLGGGALAGGALLPAPDGAGEWWRLYLASGHDLGTGSSAPTAPYVLPLALLGSLFLGHAGLVLDLLFLLAVPLSLVGAYRLARRLTDSPAAALWAATSYALLPVLTGAVQEGRLGTVVGTIVLPWLVHAASFLAPWYSADRRWRASWRTALWLALLTAFVPLAIVIALPLAVLAFAGARRSRPASTGGWLPVVVPLLVSLGLLLPWTALTWVHQGPQSWLFEAGLGAPRITEPLTPLDALFARPGGSAPWWLGIGVVLAAVFSLARPDTRRQVMRCWWVLVVALLVVVPLAAVNHHLERSVQPQPLWLGFPLVVVQGAAICAATLAATGITSRLSRSSFGWRQPVGAVVVVVALLAPVAGLAWWGIAGSDGPLTRREANPVPTYMTDTAATDPARGVLVVDGRRGEGFAHLLLRGPGLRTGEDTVLPRAEDQAELTDLVARLVSAPEPEDVDELGRLGIGSLYVPAPADIRLAGNLDSLSGVTPGSAVRPGSRAWLVDAGAAATAPVTPTSPYRPWLLAVQGLATLVVVVLAAPTRQVSR